MVYKFVYSEDQTLKGFVNSTLAVFDTSDFGDPKASDYFGPNTSVEQQVKVCRYRGYRSDPGIQNEYQTNEKWLHVFTARLIFIVVFEVRTQNNSSQVL